VARHPNKLRNGVLRSRWVFCRNTFRKESELWRLKFCMCVNKITGITLNRTPWNLIWMTHTLHAYVLCPCLTQHSRWNFFGLKVGFIESESLFV
jgi:hypothetical protein